MIIKQTPDLQKAKSLQIMAKITLERLNKTDIEKYPSNTLLDYYDIIHKLMDAILLKDGIKIKGDGSHKELIDQMFKKNYINQQLKIFLQQMREYRNRISYEGFMINLNYIELNKKYIKEIINSLFNKLNL
ncbi:hypothetical protein HOK68_01100 [Candidatus Woesearchaeota archaeon]|nr:hypothetical protein [Candidatus Woesearchaeota archaeon]MBT4387674.1 hypothetical protein [Candidatus Woesearchaeota archaeon]MBT4595963.1 hypothetical protein [Candidatus Woesearchaeota archaeon]MBT5741093.1 hypothetical protein [Candidatus Woesearchaeota archaeon]MBT6505358.1 hypothetical protein [Candidatus Woesearchaeota archaeon]